MSFSIWFKVGGIVDRLPIKEERRSQKLSTRELAAVYIIEGIDEKA
jgi:hypothetical protein